MKETIFQFKNLAILTLVVLVALFFVKSVSAAYQLVSPGDTVVIGEFVYDDDFVATTSDCTISIYNPANSLIVNEAVMSTTTNGWHYYNFSSTNPEGIWPAVMTCGSVPTGDLARLDKTFLVAYANASTTDIVNQVWNAATSSMITDGTIGKQIAVNLDAPVSTVGGSLTAADIWSYANRSLTSFGTLVSDIWNNGTRSLTTFGTLVADVWANGTRRLTDQTLTSGGSLATESFVDTSLDLATTTIVSTIETASSSLALTVPANVWAYSARSLTTFGTLTTDVATAVWANGTRSLTTFGTLVADVWANGTRRLTDQTLTSGGSLATESFVDTSLDLATSSIITEVLQNRSLISTLNDISAADVWAYGTRSINSGTVSIDSVSVDDIWAIATSTLTATGSVGKQLVENLDARVSTVGGGSLTAADVWSYATRTITDYSEDSIATAVWADASRTLTNYGNDITAADVWNVLTSSLTTVGTIGNLASTSLAALDVSLSTRAALSSQQAGWTATMSNTDRVLMGRTYRAKIYLRNYESVPTNSFSTPLLTLYDANRNVVASGVGMTNLANGIYEYTYSIPGNAAEGLWEAVVATEVESGKIIQTNDYWTVEGSPAQVIINSMTDVSTPSIAANVTITNEGISGYEYQYEWCVVSSVNNACGGGDDVYYASAAKYINSGEDWNTTLSATVSTAGDYFFKLVVYYGAESSGASRSFTATGDAPQPPPGGGGGGGPRPDPTPTSTPDIIYRTADFNRDGRVNSVDFSILLAFWRTEWPFRNIYVDVNDDREVNSVEFSIMMFQWDGNR